MPVVSASRPVFPTAPAAGRKFPAWEARRKKVNGREKNLARRRKTCCIMRIKSRRYLGRLSTFWTNSLPWGREGPKRLLRVPFVERRPLHAAHARLPGRGHLCADPPAGQLRLHAPA